MDQEEPDPLDAKVQLLRQGLRPIHIIVTLDGIGGSIGLQGVNNGLRSNIPCVEDDVCLLKIGKQLFPQQTVGIG